MGFLGKSSSSIPLNRRIWTIPQSSTSTRTEQGGSALVACGASAENPWGLVKDRECAHTGGKSHVQEEDFTKRPVSMRERKEVQELLLWEGIRVGRGRGWNGWQVHSHDRGSPGGLSASSASLHRQAWPGA